MACRRVCQGLPTAANIDRRRGRLLRAPWPLLRRRGRKALLVFAAVAPISGLAAIAWRDRWVRWRELTQIERRIEREATLVQDARTSRRALQEQIAAILVPDVETAVRAEVDQAP